MENEAAMMGMEIAMALGGSVVGGLVSASVIVSRLSADVTWLKILVAELKSDLKDIKKCETAATRQLLQAVRANGNG